MEVSSVVLFTGFLVFLAHLFAEVFNKTRIPDVLPLVFIGIMVGPVLGLVSPESFGGVGSVFVSITLVLILFDSGIGLNFSTLGGSLGCGIKLTLVNFVATSALVGFVSPLVFGFSYMEGLLLGAIIGGTSSAVVIPMVEKLRLHNGSRTTLLLESTFSDVLCIVVTLGLLQAAQYQQIRVGSILGHILASFFLAAAIGTLFAILWSSTLSRIRRLENSIFLTPAFVFIIYGITELLGYSGAISALAFGITLGNVQSLRASTIENGGSLLRPITLNKTEKAFFSEVVFLLKTFFFIYIGLSIRFTELSLLAKGVFITVLIFMLRVPVVRLSLDGRHTSKFDASLASVIVPKGLAAAVLASLPLQAGLANGALLQDVVYYVILFTITATAVLAFVIERGMLKDFYALVFSGYSADKHHECGQNAEQKGHGG